ncbi:hypothetical protein ACFJIX_27520 [Roseateles sp. UC29_93]|uniref:hypothetical protein n=1 Tax=Roseateles sp. UC29_93 TaxID=3350177 RepID=UPI00367168D7
MSLSLHEEAVRLLRKKPELVQLARETLTQWMRTNPASRSFPLWQEWLKIVESKAWSKVLAKTALAQQLRQTSPLGALVPEQTRQRVLNQMAELKNGLQFQSPVSETVGRLNEQQAPAVEEVRIVGRSARGPKQP